MVFGANNSVTGKIQKFVMRETVEARLGLKAARTA